MAVEAECYPEENGNVHDVVAHDIQIMAKNSLLQRESRQFSIHAIEDCGQEKKEASEHLQRVDAFREKKGACQPDHDVEKRDHVGRDGCFYKPFGDEAGNRPMDAAAKEAVGRCRRTAEGVEQ